MSSGKNPLMLMMALAMPGASHALGLGDIHVDSALNERLAAKIDIVGASTEELDDLRAAVANRETFLRYGAERPSFLSSATFKVGHDNQGRPVLDIRSSEPFTEPLVNFLVDLRWHNGELVREYTLLLDPAGFAAAVPSAPTARPTVESKTQTVAKIAAPIDQITNAEPSAERSGRTTTEIKVGPKATLRGIAWRLGERSPSDLQRMMIAIFRANPSAFDGNINRLFLGSVLTIPSDAQVAAITADEAKREVHSHMTAWREMARPAVAAAAIAAAPAATPPSAVTPIEAAAAASPLLSLPAAPGAAEPAAAAPSSAAVAPSAPPTPPESPTDEALDRRVHQLEQELGESKGILESKNDQLIDLQQKAARAEKVARTEAPKVIAAPRQQAEPAAAHSALAPTLTGLGVLAATLAGIYFALRRRKPQEVEASDSLVDTIVASEEAAPERPLAEIRAAAPASPPGATWPAPEPTVHVAAVEPIVAKTKTKSADSADEDMALERAIEAAAIYEATHPMLPLVPDPATAALAPAAQDFIGSTATATALLPVDATALLPLDAAAAAAVPRSDTAKVRMETKLDYNLLDLDMTVQHVQMPSVLNENPVIKERRTNLADVLKLAIEREPNRNDLRMKLLELYFSQASTNRNGFLEMVQKLAQDRDFRQSAEWEKIASMGRQIASDSPMFIEELGLEEDDLSIERKSA
jgi:pilus assembly protein FimV